MAIVDTPKQSARKFAVGDLVLCTAKVSNRQTKNQLGHIVYIDVDGTIGVEFFEYINGHSCDQHGRNGYCLWVLSSSLLLLDRVDDAWECSSQDDFDCLLSM